jgi:hypothetical protein
MSYKVLFSIKQHFCDFLGKKCGKPTFFGTVFVNFGQLGACLPPLTPSIITPCSGIPPANSLRTKQLLSRLHSL